MGMDEAGMIDDLPLHLRISKQYEKATRWVSVLKLLAAYLWHAKRHLQYRWCPLRLMAGKQCPLARQGGRMEKEDRLTFFVILSMLLSMSLIATCRHAECDVSSIVHDPK